jgi:DNA-binding MarR family transcriptional regulator
MPNEIHDPAPDAEAFETLMRTALTELAPSADVEATALVVNLLRATGRLQQDFETTVHRPAGLSFAAYRVMFTIKAAGRLNAQQLARLSNVSAASMSSLLNTLERYGLVVRRKGAAADGRMVVVELTPEGESVLAALQERNHRREVEWASALTRRERQTMTRLLRKLIAFRPAREAGEPPRLVNNGGDAA